MADKDFNIRFKTTSDTSGAKRTEDALEGVDDAAKKTTKSTAKTSTSTKKSFDDLEKSQVKVIDSTKRSTRATEENRIAFEKWQKERDAARRGGGSSLATDPAEFFREEEQAMKKATAEQERAIQAKRREAAESARLKEAQRKLREERQRANEVVARQKRTINSASTAMTAGARRMTAFSAVVRSFVSPWALVGTAIGFATAGVTTWIRNLKDSKKESESAADSLDKLKESFEGVDEEREKLKEGRFETALETQTRAIKQQNKDLERNIETLKRREKIVATLEEQQFADEIASVERGVAAGRIEESEGDRRLAELRKQQIESDLARQARMGELDEQVIQSRIASTEQQLQAQREQTQTGETVLEALAKQREQALKLRQEVEKFGNQFSGERRKSGEVSRGRLLLNQAAIQGVPTEEAEQQTIAPFFDAISNFQSQGAIKSGFSEALTGAIDERLKSIEEAMKANVEFVGESSKEQLSTKQEIKSLEKELERLNKTNDEQLTEARLQGRIKSVSETLQESEMTSADKTREALDEVVSGVGEAAKEPAVAKTIESLKSMLEDGLQADEINQVRDLTTQLLKAFEGDQIERRDMSIEITQTLQEAVNQTRASRQEIARLRQELESLRDTTQLNALAPNP